MKRLLLFLLFLPSICSSQRYIWEKFYGTDKNDHVYKTFKTKDGGRLFVGYSDSIFFLKIDSAFNLKWLYKQPYEYIYDVVMSPDGSITAACGSISAGTNPYLIKYDSLGNVLWLKNYPYLKGNYFNKIYRLSDGSYFVTFWHGPRRNTILKFDSSGDSLWSLPILPAYIYPLQDSFIVISNNNFSKYTNNGMLVFDKPINLPFSVIRIQPAREGYLVTGASGSSGVGLALMNRNFDTIWTGKYNFYYSGPWPSDVQRTADGGFLIFGHSKTFDPTNNRDFYIFQLVKTDEFGKFQWGKPFKEGFGQVISLNMDLGCDSSIVIIGTVDGGSRSSRDIMIQKIDRLPYVFGPCRLSDTEDLKAGVKIFPNPVINNIHIQLHNATSGLLTIYNVLGQQVIHLNLENQKEIDIPFCLYSKGLYSISIVNRQSGEILKKKFIKQQ